MGNVLESVRERATHNIAHIERMEKVQGNRVGRHGVIVHEQTHGVGKKRNRSGKAGGRHGI